MTLDPTPREARDVRLLPPAQRKISMAFQSYALFPRLTVGDHILFGVRVRREPKQQYGRRHSSAAGQEQVGRKPVQKNGNSTLAERIARY